MRLAGALLLAALALTGCESTQEENAKAEKEASKSTKLAEARTGAAQRGAVITHVSTSLKVVGSTVIAGSEGDVAVITLRNTSASAQRAVPIQITVRNASGKSIYTNAIGGLSPSLTSASYIPARGEINWVDDQITAAGKAASVTARVGEGQQVSGQIPSVSVSAPKSFEESAGSFGAEGTVSNRSTIAQQELVIYAVARAGARIVGAGRAVIHEAAPGSSTRFQAFMIGSIHGAALEVQAPPTTFG